MGHYSGGGRGTAAADTEGLLPVDTASPGTIRHTISHLPAWIRYGAIGVVVGLCIAALALSFKLGSGIFYTSSSWRFITANGTTFMDGDDPFNVVGFNIHNFMEIGMPQIRKGMDADHPDTVDSVLSQLHHDGVNVIRLFAHTTDPRYPFQESPGVYNEDAFESLDHILASCKTYGIRVVLSMVDTWKYHGGVQEFIDFSDTAPPREFPPPVTVDGDFDYSRMTMAQEDYEKQRMTLFFSDDGAMRLYRNHVETILRRRNKITGMQYKDDPSIFSLSLLNEMRCEASHDNTCPEAVHAWISNVVEHIQTIDTHHMITIGEEGFYATKNRREYNPGDWAADNGQDFIRDHLTHPGISYASIHIWPTTWQASSNFSVDAWISSHVEDARDVLQKPLLIEEFGYPIHSSYRRTKDIQNLRDPMVNLVYGYVNQSIREGNSLRGSLLWEYSLQMYADTPMQQYSILPDSTTYQLMKTHAHSIT